ncbi:bile acid:sodium symporter family protein [Enterococcus xiangfangensis]|uniref:Bile acid:sodium symporter family protein n=1 Tax=Enterococcus xiangfangensis TaxID=1296537 RepID=A0ABU3FCI4_9ENTE|nr:bile acid:sodium symporter family protein [Enterococcus xiangfangensis]MBM7711548.1 BASS family bile acid:Na+ symporter [Enterococcus xiangfangensis]MDT2760384.1 bile acid:sodium symporter family protein [Enterococcus xiangfangensis]
MELLNKVAKTLQQNFAIFTIVIALAAYFIPDLFLWSGPYMNLLMGLVIFGMSLTMEMKDFKELFTAPKATIVGLLCVFVVSTAGTLGIVYGLQLPTALKVGLLLCAASPGGNITNVLTFIAKGDVALSIGLTSLATFLAPVITPSLCLLLLGEVTEMDGPGMIKTMIISVIIPLIIGLLLKALAKDAVLKVSQFSPMISLVAISIMTGGLVAGRREALLSLNWKTLVGGVLFLAFSAGLSYLIAKFLGINQFQRRAVSIEAGFKNTVLSAMLAGVSFSQYPEAALLCIIVALMAAVLGPVYANALAKIPITDNSEPTSIKKTVIEEETA